MAEPNMEFVVEMLKNGDYNEKNGREREVFKMPNSNERIGWLLYYLMEDKIEVLYEGIKERSDDDRRGIFAHLVGLYPLSRNIILHMFRNASDEADLGKFIEEYDMDNRMLEMLEETVSEVSGSTSDKSRELREYRERIVKIKEEIEKKEAEYEEAKQLKQEHSELYKNLNMLESDIEKNSKTEEELRDEIKEKEQESTDQKKNIKKAEAALERIKKEIDDLQKITDEEEKKMPDDYKRVLGSVQKAMRDLDKIHKTKEPKGTGR